MSYITIMCVMTCKTSSNVPSLFWTFKQKCFTSCPSMSLLYRFTISTKILLTESLEMFLHDFCCLLSFLVSEHSQAVTLGELNRADKGL